MSSDTSTPELSETLTMVSELYGQEIAASCQERINRCPNDANRIFGLVEELLEEEAELSIEDVCESAALPCDS